MSIRVIVAKNIGFCFGVRRSVEMVERLLDSENKVYVTGELIHNERVVDELKRKGMVSFDPYSSLPEDLNSHIVVVRAHGLPPNVLEKLKKRSKKLVDTTCPIVMDMFKTATTLAENHDRLFVLGNPDHPEMIALKGHVKKVSIFGELSELNELLKETPSNPDSSVALISQTTKDLETFKKSAELLLEYFKNLTIRRTICDVTIEREREVERLSKESDLILVVGSESSSNTRKLLKIALKNTKAFLISNPEKLRDIEEEICNSSKISIVSGTSAPDDLVFEIIDRLKKFCEEVDVVWNR